MILPLQGHASNFKVTQTKNVKKQVKFEVSTHSEQDTSRKWPEICAISNTGLVLSDILRSYDKLSCQKRNSSVLHLKLMPETCKGRVETTSITVQSESA